MQRSALLRAELEDAVAGMTPAARAVFEDIQGRDEDADPNLPEDFHALTPIERTSVIGAAKLLKDLAEAEPAEEADDQKHSEGVSRLERQLWIGSVLISLAFLIAVGGILVRVYTAPTTPDPADTVVTTPDEVTRFLDACSTPAAWCRAAGFYPHRVVSRLSQLRGDCRAGQFVVAVFTGIGLSCVNARNSCCDKASAKLGEHVFEGDGNLVLLLPASFERACCDPRRRAYANKEALIVIAPHPCRQGRICPF